MVQYDTIIRNGDIYDSKYATAVLIQRRPLMVQSDGHHCSSHCNFPVNGFAFTCCGKESLTSLPWPPSI